MSDEPTNTPPPHPLSPTHVSATHYLDTRLVKLVRRHGLERWIEVASLLPGELSAGQVQERWGKPKGVRDDPGEWDEEIGWSASEDAQLVYLVLRLGDRTQWALIGEKTGRPAESCERRRLDVLKEDHVPLAIPTLPEPALQRKHPLNPHSTSNRPTLSPSSGRVRAISPSSDPPSPVHRSRSFANHQQRYDSIPRSPPSKRARTLPDAPSPLSSPPKRHRSRIPLPSLARSLPITYIYPAPIASTSSHHHQSTRSLRTAPPARGEDPWALLEPALAAISKLLEVVRRSEEEEGRRE